MFPRSARRPLLKVDRLLQQRRLKVLSIQAFDHQSLWLLDSDCAPLRSSPSSISTEQLQAHIRADDAHDTMPRPWPPRLHPQTRKFKARYRHSLATRPLNHPHTETQRIESRNSCAPTSPSSRPHLSSYSSNTATSSRRNGSLSAANLPPLYGKSTPNSPCRGSHEKIY